MSGTHLRRGDVSMKTTKYDFSTSLRDFTQIDKVELLLGTLVPPVSPVASLMSLSLVVAFVVLRAKLETP